MFSDLKRNLAIINRNIKGWTTHRKIVVIESDDWGSIRMPSKKVYQKCLKAGYPVHLNPYEKYDSLASKEDLELLFDLLLSIKDSVGNHPVITANCAVANPNFKKIKEDRFQNYHYELITETFKNYKKHSSNLNLWKMGNENRIFFHQFHVREHLNVSKFMNALKTNDADVHFGFENRMPGNIRKSNKRNGNLFVEATHYNTQKDKLNILITYLEGLDIFEKLFGYKSASIIPANYTWSQDFDHPVAEKEVKIIQGIRKMREPIPGHEPKYYYRYLGKRNQYDQISLVRNVTFEPALLDKTNITGRCLKEISIAFKMKKPAIISSHRLNYIGFIDEKNRDRNLKMLNHLLRNIIMRWPEVEFMNSVELGTIIASDDRNS